jgi:PKHD-type hydroxylase
MFYTWDKPLTKEECEFLLSDCISGECQNAKTGQDTSPLSASPEIRKTKIKWVDNSKLITYAMSGYVNDANNNYFKYEITHNQPIQFAEYTGGDHYTWHTDAGNNEDNVCRKLSTVILLSDPNDFEGGDFEIFTGDKVDKPFSRQGSVVVMDSRDWHRVTPVTKGVRYSLVMWTMGPRLR